MLKIKVNDAEKYQREEIWREERERGVVERERGGVEHDCLCGEKIFSDYFTKMRQICVMEKKMGWN